MTEQELIAIIEAELKKVAPETDPADLTAEENLREALNIDSFSFLRVLVGIGEQTGIEIPEADYSKVGTMAAIIQYLAAHIP